MEDAGISQQDLAEQLGLSASQVSRWFTANKNRRVDPGLKSLQRIERAIAVLRKRKGES